MQAQGFVPAWKRLGLQLKRPSETSTHDGPHHEGPPAKRIRASPQVNGDASERGEPVRSKVNGSKGETRNEVNGVSVAPSTGPLPVPTASNGVKKQKKVAFAQSVQTAAINRDDQTAADDKPNRVKPASGPPIPHDPTQHQIEKRAKRAARTKKPSVPAQPEAAPKADLPPLSDDSKAYLRYLHIHHLDPETWKFNKSLQTALLKNAFDVYRIPPAYDTALHDYLLGLKGRAARDRLEQQGREILAGMDEATPDESQVARLENAETTKAKEMEEMERRHDEEMQADRHAAQRRDAQIVKQAVKDTRLAEEEASDEYKLKRIKRRRADQILEALAASASVEPTSAEPQSAQSASQNVARAGTGIKPEGDVPEAESSRTQTRPRGKRGRKRRTLTGVPDDDDISSASSVSSSETSSTTDSDSDADSDSESDASDSDES
ncbi:MAG: hypothetical protein M1828_000810 [Chrysothrix sp. TS-e1954]|nr:MAG: hypothetical protein M1828_000810 [Chrysothrix sp. TS-e1954]